MFSRAFVLHVLGFLLIIEMVESAANNSLADCQKVAAQFMNTVSNGPVANIVSTVGVNVSCPQIANTSCPGAMVNGICVWQRKLSVTCINGSTIRIRVQSNGLPPRCTMVPSFAMISERNIDFEVNFNPDVNINQPTHAPTTQAELNNIVCNISNHQKVPTASAYVLKQNSVQLHVLAGLAVDGIAILNVNSINQVDPFYPTGGFAQEGADQCLSHPTFQGEFHYHVASGCILNPPVGNVTGCSPTIGCANNIANYSIATFSNYKNLTVIGIAKDGHVIYGPYLSTGYQVTSGFDMCNGMFYDSIGNYGYFVTSTYPYITGCFGPGNYPSFAPNCTTNGVSRYSMSSYASTFVSSAKTDSPIHFMTFILSLIIIMAANNECH